jgi:hypothetical protein
MVSRWYVSSITRLRANQRGRRGGEAKKLERLHATLFGELVGKTMNGSFTAFWRKVLPSETPMKCWNAGEAQHPNCLQEMPAGSLIEIWHSDKTNVKREDALAGITKVDPGVWPECLNCAAESRVADIFEDFESAIPHPYGGSDVEAFVGGYVDLEELMGLETVGEAGYETLSAPGIEANDSYAGCRQDFSVVLERLESEWGEDGKEIPQGPSLLDICHYIILNEFKSEYIKRFHTFLWEYQEGSDSHLGEGLDAGDCLEVAQWIRACPEREGKVVRSYLLDLNAWDKGVAHFFAIIAKELHPNSRLVAALETIATAPVKSRASSEPTQGR